MPKPAPNLPTWMVNPPTTLAGKAALLIKKRSHLRSPGRKGKFLRNLLRETEQAYKDGIEAARALQPLADFKPSYEQALLLNAWMYGKAFISVYSANRIGKTTAAFINLILWIYPNNPKWKIFQPYTDHLNRRVRVFQRPDISSLKRINDLFRQQTTKALTATSASDSSVPPQNAPVDPEYIAPPNPSFPHYHPDNFRSLQSLQSALPGIFTPAWPDPPWNKGGTVWFGAPDQDHHEKVMMPLWKQYLPAQSIERWVPSDREISLKIPHPTTTGKFTAWEIIGKSYESKDTKWSSGAVDAIMFTEGITPQVFNEARLRFKDPAIGSHDFTPYLPANSGAASALAQRIAKGKEHIPLPHHVFTKFRVYDAPDHIIPPDKKRELIKTFENHPEGKARLEGEFYSSSMLVLSYLDRTIHLLPWTKGQLFQKYPTGQIYRALDPGLDHPTAAAWGYLLPINVWVIYRVFAQQGLTISQRVEKIIHLSKNTRARVVWGDDPKTDYYFQEINPSPISEIPILTTCDYHTFKRDEVTGNPYSLNYQVQGLQITESVHTGPEDRATYLNELLLPSNYYPHLLTGKPPGPRVYFLQDEPGIMEFFLKMEEFYWERKKTGEDRGNPKDKIPEHKDDELDAITYLTSSPYRWTKYRPPARIAGDSEPEEAMIEASQRVRRVGALYDPDDPYQNSKQRLQSLQSQSVSYFGGSPEDVDYDEDYDEG